MRQYSKYSVCFFCLGFLFKPAISEFSVSSIFSWIELNIFMNWSFFLYFTDLWHN